MPKTHRKQPDTSNETQTTPTNKPDPTETAPEIDELKMIQTAGMIDEEGDDPMVYDAVTTLNNVERMYAENASLFMSGAQTLKQLTASGKFGDGFSDTFFGASQMLVDVLEELSKLHPFIRLALVSFKAAISLDQTRRECNKMVLFIRLKMRDALCVLLDLRHISDPKEKSSDGRTIRERLHYLVKEVDEKIKRATSDCDAYSQKKLLPKIFHGPKFQEIFANHIQSFDMWAKDVQFALILHTAHTGRQVYETVERQEIHLLEQGTALREQSMSIKAQGKTLKEIGKNLVEIRQCLHRLETKKERDILHFIKENGGPHAVVESDATLMQLIEKSGETLASIAGPMTRSIGGTDDIRHVRGILTKEIDKSIEQSLDRHFTTFGRTLNLLRDQNNQIMTLLQSGAHDEIIDPELRQIWKAMGWKRNVKARHFFVALHDHYVEKYNLSSLLYGAPPRSTNSAASAKDYWALEYVNASTVQQITEAIDDDGTGFISVVEVNQFVSSRPPEWSVLEWFAYWAADYLDQPALIELERLLRSTHGSYTIRGHNTTTIDRLIRAFEYSEEERLKNRLASMSYEIDRPENVVLVTGLGRIERYIFPLFCLLLERDARIIRLATKKKLHLEELSSSHTTMDSVVHVMYQRIDTLEATYKQTHIDAQTKLGLIAFGMLQLSYRERNERFLRRADSTFQTWLDNSDSSNDHDQQVISVNDIPTSELKLGVLDMSHIEVGLSDFKLGHEDPKIGEISGEWSGYRYILGLLEPCVELFTIRLTSGSGNGKLLGTALLDGELVPISGGIYLGGIWFASEGKYWSFTGFYDAEKAVISGSWQESRERTPENHHASTYHHLPNQPQTTNQLKFFLTKTPARFQQFRPRPWQDYKPAERSRARWKFAMDATRHEVRRKLHSRSYYSPITRDLRIFAQLTYRLEIEERGYSLSSPVTEEDIDALRVIHSHTDPALIRRWQSLVDSKFKYTPTSHYTCNSCHKRILQTHLFCLTCATKDFLDTIDLCKYCENAIVKERGMEHSPDHTIVQFRSRAFFFAISQMLPHARPRITRIKSLTPKLESEPSSNLRYSRYDRKNERTKALNPNRDSCRTRNLTCYYCKKAVTIPCWVCAECSHDVVVCLQCEALPATASIDKPSSKAISRTKKTSASTDIPSNNQTFDGKPTLISNPSTLSGDSFTGNLTGIGSLPDGPTVHTKKPSTSTIPTHKTKAHQHNHALLRIGTSAPDPQEANSSISMEIKMMRLEKQIENFELVLLPLLKRLEAKYEERQGES